MKRKVCQSIELHYLADDDVAEFQFGDGWLLLATASYGPQRDDGNGYDGWPHYTEIRLYAPGISPHPRTGNVTVHLSVGTNGEGNRLSPSLDAADVYVRREERPRCDPWLMMLLGGYGESGSVPVDNPELVVLRYY